MAPAKLFWALLSSAALVLAGSPARASAGGEGEGSTRSPAPYWGGHFHNICPDAHRGGLSGFLRLTMGLGPKEAPLLPPSEVPAYKPDVVRPDLDRIRHPDPGRIQVTWIGQSSFLIQFDGLNILTDPLFSRFASPVHFAGPKRVVPPGLRFSDLPPIDAVVISHSHYDHLDRPTIRRLGNRPRYFIPRGTRAWFGRLGIDRVSELDWWESSYIGPTVFRFVPALHWAGRSAFTRNRDLWGGWVIETPKGKVYFAGDTGYCRVFSDIAANEGPIRLALLPIGTYWPSWYFKPMHMDPAEAVRAFRDLGAAEAIGMHWGTIKTSREPLAEPPLFLRKALAEAGLPPESFRVMGFGGTLVFDW